MQSVSYAIVWSPRHWGFANRVVADARPWGMASIAWIATIAVLVVGGITLLNAAVQTLGRQWSLVARVASGHDLVTTGPYGHVRHPIYTAMLLMLIATGLAISGPARLAIAVAVFTLGTALRVRAEERCCAPRSGPRSSTRRSASRRWCRVPARIERDAAPADRVGHECDLLPRIEYRHGMTEQTMYLAVAGFAVLSIGHRVPWRLSHRDIGPGL